MMIFALVGTICCLCLYAEACVTIPETCTFPFTSHYDSQQYSTCVSKGDNATSDHFCSTTTRLLQDEKTLNLVKCDVGCFNDAGEPLPFGGDTYASSLECKSQTESCVFPFTYGDVTYDACTADQGVGSDTKDYEWCAVEVDSDGLLVEGRWGKCDMATCNTFLESQQSLENVVSTSDEGCNDPISIEIIRDEGDADSSNDDFTLEVHCLLKGLKPSTAYTLSIFDIEKLKLNVENKENPDEICKQVASKNNSALSELFVDSYWTKTLKTGDDVSKSLNTFFKINSDETDVFKSDSNLVDGKLGILKHEDEVIFCGLLKHLSEDGWFERFISSFDNFPSLVVIIFILVAILSTSLILSCIYCYCKTKRRSGEHKISMDEPMVHTNPCGTGMGFIDPKNGSTHHPQPRGGQKRPLFDELSIPFIDASPSATPKIRRKISEINNFLSKSSKKSASLSASKGSLTSSVIT